MHKSRVKFMLGKPDWRSLSRILKVLSIALVLGFVETRGAIAQIVPDNTLGNERSQLTPNNVIEGGATRGANLFHSFSEFNIGEGQQVNFANPNNIQRIFSRVTGNNRSQILGTLGVLGNADLFLLNPNGIVFGPNAQLNVGGSFLATTANSFKFPDGSEFSATNPQAPPLLTVNVPIGLQYNGNNSSIQVQGSVLEIPTGRTLALVGGDVSANGALLRTVGGRIELGGLVAPGMVEIISNSDTLQLSFPKGVARGNIFLNRDGFQTDLNVRGTPGGSIALNANNIAIADSLLRSGINPETTNPNSQAGDITIDATGVVTITDASSILNTVRSEGIGNAGNISITAQSVSLTNGTQLQASTFGQGNAGNVTIQADSVTILGEDREGFSSGIFSNVQRQAVGEGGNITIEANSLSLGGGAELSSSISGRGNAGIINLQIRGPVVLDGKTSGGFTTYVHSDVNPGAIGKGGNVNITAESLSITGGATVSVTTGGQGDSGSINIQVQDALLIDGANSVNGIGSGIGAGAVGNGGNIQIGAETVVLSNSGLIQVSTSGQGKVGDLTIQARSLISNSGGGLQTSAFGQGDAGNIFLNISDLVDLSGTSSLGASSGFFSGTRETASGRGGSISVVTDRLRIADGAVISARTLNDFRGGDIKVNANRLELTDGGQILATAATSGQGGDIAINAADRILITGFDPTFNARLAQFGRPTVDPAGAASGVYVSTTGGIGGNIRIRADSLTLNNQAQISAETFSNTGGNITLDVSNLLLLRRGSSLSTTAGTAQAGGDGGNIAIAAGFLVAFPTENSNIAADAFTGRGGNINITTQGIYGIEFRARQTPLSDITASSQFGVNGVVNINTPEVDPAQGAIELPTTFSIPSLARGCETRGSETSSFVNTGRGGVPTNPTAPLIADTLWQDLELLGEIGKEAREQRGNSDRPVRSEKPNSPIVEAQGWVVLSNGAIVLSAQAPTVTPNSMENQSRVFCR